MNQVSEYYIVPKDIYELKKQEQIQVPERFGDVPKSARKKVLKLAEWLKINRISVSDSVIAYAARGRFRPIDWEENIQNLFQVPPRLLSLRVYNEVKRLKRRKQQP